MFGIFQFFMLSRMELFYNNFSFLPLLSVVVRGAEIKHNVLY